MTLLAIYRAWARDERERLDGPPRGEGGSSDDEHGPIPDIGALIEHLSKIDGLTPNIVEAKLLPVYKQLRRDRDIEGRVCRGEDRVAVGNRVCKGIFTEIFRYSDVGCCWVIEVTSIISG